MFRRKITEEILKWKNSTGKKKALVIKGMRQIKHCRICGFLSDEDECIFCKDKTRSRSTLMVVAYPQDVAAIEKTGSYKGMYHVLGGLISSSKGIYPEDINIEGLEGEVTLDSLRAILDVDKALWREDAKGIEEFYAKFGDRLPKVLREELDTLEANCAE